MLYEITASTTLQYLVIYQLKPIKKNDALNKMSSAQQDLKNQAFNLNNIITFKITKSISPSHVSPTQLFHTIKEKTITFYNTLSSE